jgi:xylitol oxidase
MKQLKNWAMNQTYGASEVLTPRTAEELQELVTRYPIVKPLGTRHSFNRLADTSGVQVSMEHFTDVKIDEEQRQVTVGGGLPYGKLCRLLDERGFAIHNLASLPHISVAGACATATHGSGDKNGNLATEVAAMEMVTPDGDLLRFSRAEDAEKLNGAAVNLGALCFVTSLTLDLVPAFQMSQVVYEDLPFDALAAHFDEITSAGYSVSLFTDWRSAINQVWVKSELGNAPMEYRPELFGAKLATRKLHPLPDMPSEFCTEQLGEPGPWYERLPHFRMEFTPSSGDELQTEYLVPRQHILRAIEAVARLGERISPLLHVSEMRTIAADELWMSPCYRQACVGIHFTWQKRWDDVQPLLPVIEEALAPFGARPHWGKLFAMTGKDIRSLYPKVAEFVALADKLDPNHKMKNELLFNILRQ